MNDYDRAKQEINDFFNKYSSMANPSPNINDEKILLLWPSGHQQ